MQKRSFTEQDIETLEEHIVRKSLRDAAIFRIGLDTDPELSLTDVLSLKTTDVIHLGEIKSSLQIKTKRGPLAEVHLSEKSMDLLDYYTDQLIDEDGEFVYLFESKNKKGKPLSNSHWNRTLKNYCEELGINTQPKEKPSPLPITESIDSSPIEKKLKIIQNFLSHTNRSLSQKAKEEILLSLRTLLPTN